MKQCYSPEFVGEFIPGLGYTGHPRTIVQALHEMPLVDWSNMVETIFPDRAFEDVSVHDVLTLIKETNTCTDRNTNPVEVWITSDFRIKVYHV